jgi:hypothetical protein
MYMSKVVIMRLATGVCLGVVPLLVIFDNEERPAHAARVRQQPELALPDIPDDRNLVRDQALAPELPQLQDEIVRVLVDAHPVAVEEDLPRQHNRPIFCKSSSSRRSSHDEWISGSYTRYRKSWAQVFA